MTKYEKWALIISIIALIIPIIQWIWNKWIVKPKLKFYPTGRAYLFANKSGSYIQVEGVYEAQKKPISIKKISLKVVRKKDDVALNLNWSIFTNPVNQKIMGAIAYVSEIAHPFRIDADNVVCAFTEFTDFYETSSKNIQPYLDALVEELNKINLSSMSYMDAYNKFVSLSSYKDAKEALLKENFWEIGLYEIKIKVEYGKNKKEFNYDFEVSKEAKEDLNYNVNIVLESYLDIKYNVAYCLKPVRVELREIKK